MTSKNFPRAGRPGPLTAVLLLLTLLATDAAPAPAAEEPLRVRRLTYDGRLSEGEARFTADFEVESTSRSGGIIHLLEGDLAVLPGSWPNGVSLLRHGNRFDLAVSRAGEFRLRLQFVVKAERHEPWNEVRFTGPLTGVGCITVTAGEGAEMELRSGIPVDVGLAGAKWLRGVLGADREVALRWRGRAAEGVRQTVVTCETLANVRAAPAVLQFTTELRYQVSQGQVSGFVIALPRQHALTGVEGEQIRDWQLRQDGDPVLLRVDLVRPTDQSYVLRLHSEQTVESLPCRVDLALPEPRDIDRESGLLTLQAQEVTWLAAPQPGLRQVNAAVGIQAAYRFHGRPALLTLNLGRLEPVLRVSDRIQARLEDHRLLVDHMLDTVVEKTGVYSLELGPLNGLTVSDVRGDGLAEWTVREDRLHLGFNSRVLGTRVLTVRLEQPHRVFPEFILVEPLTVAGAIQETAQVGVATAPGMQLKTAAVDGLRETPVTQLAGQGESSLAYTALQSGWSLKLAAERLAPRVVADIFNLVTVGDGLVGGSATLRYAILNQGVREFRLRLPAAWRNIEFTGPNIRHKEQDGDTWTIGLQDKVWGGYTLVVTYDEPLDPHAATLALGGIHALDVERETGSLALTSAGGLQLREVRVAGPLERIDEAELAQADRALITRTTLLAYRYADAATPYELQVEARRFDAASVLAAVADRTQLTTVITEDGQMLTQAGFMVKNHDKQFQQFDLPDGAKIWSALVNGEPVKVEQQGATLRVPLPREADRDRVFAVQLVYAQQAVSLRSSRPHQLALAAPRTDVQTTYAEWELFTPSRCLLQAFGGSMRVARGTTYDWIDAWTEVTTTYGDLVRHNVGLLAGLGLLVLLAVFITAAIRRGLQGLISVTAVLAILVVLAGMLLPALAKAKAKAQRISAVNHLKQIGLAARVYATDNREQLPASFEAMKTGLATDKVTVDPQTGRRFVYLGGILPERPAPDAVLAYSPDNESGGRAVLLVDGSVHQTTEERFNAMLQQTLAQGQGQGQLRPQALHPGVEPQTLARLQPQPGAAPSPALALPISVGLRPIRIELPRTGRRLVFTKVLNVQREPLSVEAWVVRASLWTFARSTIQISAFLAGLGLLWRQLRRAQPRSLIVTLGVVLVMASVAGLLLSTRLLGTALILVVPLVILAGLVFLFRRQGIRFFQNPQAEASAPDAGAGVEVARVAPVAPLLIVIGFLILPVNARDTNPPAPEILSAQYSATVGERVARIEAAFRVRVPVGGGELRLLPDEVAIESFSTEARGARLVRRPGHVAVSLPRPGEVSLRLAGVVKTGGEAAQRQLAFGIPPALVSRVTAVVNEPEATVAFPAAVAYTTRAEGTRTRIEALLGAADRVELSWTPRVKRAAEMTATVFCRSASRLTFSAGTVHCRTRLDYQVTQGELHDLVVELPSGHRLLKVEGDLLRTWHVETPQGGAPSVLRVQLVRGVVADCHVILETERSLEALPVSAELAIPHPTGVKRETGWVGLSGGDELGLAVEAQQGLQKRDAAEFPAADAGDGPVSAAYQFLRPGFQLRVRVEALQPQVEVVVRHLVHVDLDEVRLESRLEYTIQRAGVFNLRLDVPPTARIDALEMAAESSAPQPLTWTERTEEGRRSVEVALRERTLGHVPLVARVTIPLRELPRELPVPAVTPLDATKVVGHVVVAAEPGVQLKTQSVEGLVEVPATSVPGTVGGLAFKCSGQEPAAPWRLTVATERVESWLRAETVHWLMLGEGRVAGRAVVRFEVQNAPAREFRLRVPETFRNVEVQAANVRRRDQDGAIWRLELQNRVTGPVTVNVTWDQPWPSTPAGQERAFEFSGVEALGVERETGWIAIGTRRQMELAGPGPEGDLLRIDTQELPDWAGQPESTTVLAFRYLRAGYRLSLTARRFTPAEMLQALVDDARLTTVLAEDGQMMTELVLAVRNNGRQFLAVRLPSGAEVWSAFVNGQPVRPGQQEGRLLLPLERSVDETTSLPVQLTYVSTAAFPRRHGRVTLESPSLDLPVKNARWELYLPADFDYDRFGGTMAHESEAARILGAFSADEYSQAESLKRREQNQQLSNSILEAKSKLARGELEGASKAYGKMVRRYGAGESQTQLRDLERELRRAQTGNLRRAQDNLLANSIQTGVHTQTAIQYDDQVAGQQWAKLQQAQEVATSAARPLRVNLPTRGLRFAFTQALQTDVGRPLRVEFVANNLRAANWPLRVLGAGGGLLCLWALVAALLRPYRPPKASTAAPASATA